MDADGPTAGYILFGLLIVLDIFMYGFEMAIETLRSKDMEKLLGQEDTSKAKRIRRVLEPSYVYEDVLVLMISLINLGIGAYLMQLSGQKHGLILLAVFVYIFMTIGVLLPRKLAGRLPEKWACFFITPIYWVMCILRPFTFVVSITTRFLMLLMGFKGDGNENDVTEEEIINMVNEGQEQGILQASEAEMISNIFEFGDKETQDIMTHRNDICGIDASMNIQEVIAYMLDNRNSRYPVYDENIDQIIGILHFKDAMRFHVEEADKNSALKELKGLLREAVFVPKTKNIDELFKEMQSRKLQMVIVIDEYGQTEGLVAMEDILEEIVGNILDEYDTEEEYIEEAGNDEYIIEGKTPLEELEELLGISFEEESFDTVNGFLISKLDRIPDEDEEFDTDYQGYNFKIISVQNKMIQSVLVTKLSVAEEEEESALDENTK